MTTPLAYGLQWADEALVDLADEATQRVAWFPNSLNLMDCPGGMICNVLPCLEALLANGALGLSPGARMDLARIESAIVAYQHEVGLDPDPALTIDHPQWCEIRALAKQVHQSLFGQQKVLLERAMRDCDILSVREVAGRRLYSHQNALRLLKFAREAGFGCLWIEEWDERPDAGSGRHMIGGWTERGSEHQDAEWMEISHKAAQEFLGGTPASPVPSFWLYLWRFQNEEATS